MSNRRRVIVADIDGCCLDNSARMHHYYEGNFELYHANWHLDRPKAACIDVYRKYLHDPHFDFLFVTSRGEQSRSYTMEQLHFHIWSGIQNRQLAMRPHNCNEQNMPDPVYKAWAVTNAGYNISDIFLAFDDRNSVVAAWRELGVTCFQPQLGDH